MADKASNSAEELTQAYNQAISSGFAVGNAAIDQATSNAKAITNAVQAERDEYGKAFEKAAGQVRARGESIVGVMQGMAAIPVPTTSTFPDEAKKAFGQLIETEMAFYQAWTKGWTDYFAGVEERRSAAAKAALESNVKVIEAGQEAVKSAVKFGESYVDWTLETAKGKK